MKRLIEKADMLEPLTLDLPEDTYIDEEIIKDVIKIQQRLTKEYLSTIKK